MEAKYIILILIIISFFTIITIINNIITLSKKVERSKSVIDVYLKKRFDLIPNLVEIIKGYTNYEQKTLTEITKLRSEFNETKNEKTGQKLNEHYQKLIALTEEYPQIKASENFLQLQKTLTKIESEIEASRRLYIIAITTYNTKIETFPNNIFAKLLNYQPVELPTFDTGKTKTKF